MEHHKLSRAHWYIVCNYKGLPIFFFLNHKECFTKCKGDANAERSAEEQQPGAEQPMRECQAHCRQVSAVHTTVRVQRMKHPLSWSWADKELWSSASCQYRGVRAHLQCSCTLIFTSGCAMLMSTTQISLSDLDLDRLMRLVVHKQEKLELSTASPPRIKTWIKLWYKLGAATHF